MAILTHIDALGREHRWRLDPATPRLTVGRSSTCDIIIKDQTVSRHHCTLELQGGHYTLDDNESTSGTWVNGTRVELVRVRPGDEIRVGDVQLQLSPGDGDSTLAVGGPSTVYDQPPFDATLSWTDPRGIPQSLALGPLRAVVDVGRMESCQLHINADAVSRHHAHVRWAGDRWEVVDLESANGTTLGGEPIERSWLQDGDIIGFGGIKVHFSCPRSARQRNPTPPPQAQPPPPDPRTFVKRDRPQQQAQANVVESKPGGAPAPLDLPQEAPSDTGGHDPIAELMLERDAAQAAVAELQRVLQQTREELERTRRALDDAHAEIRRLRG